MNCKICRTDFRNHCLLHEDTLPKDCSMIKHHLAMAKEILPNDIQIFVKYTEMHAIFFIAKDGVVVSEHMDPRALIGEVMIRRDNPEWFDAQGFAVDGEHSNES